MGAPLARHLHQRGAQPPISRVFPTLRAIVLNRPARCAIGTTLDATGQTWYNDPRLRTRERRPWLASENGFASNG